MAEITNAQKKCIKMAQRRLGMDDEDYRAMLDAQFGVRSCTRLSRRQAHRLIMHLHAGKATDKDRTRRPIKNPAKPRQVDADGTVVTLPTPKQYQFLHDLEREVAWDHADGYRRWLKTCLGLEKVRTRNEASQVIQGLKGLKRGGHKRRTG